MTAPAPSPEPVKRSKRLYVYWGIALALLLAAGLFCWLVVPVWQVRALVAECHKSAKTFDAQGSVTSSFTADFNSKALSAIQETGGPEEGARRLGNYLRLPRWIAPHRSTALYMLMLCKRSGAVSFPTVAALAKDKNEELGARIAAARALGAIAGTDQIDPLLVVTKESSPELRAGAVHALGEIGAPRAIPVLAELLIADKSSNVRSKAAWAMMKIGHPDSVDPLLRGLQDTSLHVRLACVESLGRSGDSRAVAPLQEIASDANDPARQAAAEALKKIEAAQEKEK